jgi:hypothetical protein
VGVIEAKADYSLQAKVGSGAALGTINRHAFGVGGGPQTPQYPQAFYVSSGCRLPRAVTTLCCWCSALWCHSATDHMPDTANPVHPPPLFLLFLEHSGWSRLHLDGWRAVIANQKTVSHATDQRSAASSTLRRQAATIPKCSKFLIEKYSQKFPQFDCFVKRGRQLPVSQKKPALRG